MEWGCQGERKQQEEALHLPGGAWGHTTSCWSHARAHKFGRLYNSHSWWYSYHAVIANAAGGGGEKQQMALFGRIVTAAVQQKQEVVGTKLLQITWRAPAYFLNICSLTNVCTAIHFQSAKNCLISKKSKSLELLRPCAVYQILYMLNIWHFIKWLCIILSIVSNTTRKWKLKCYLKNIK